MVSVFSVLSVLFVLSSDGERQHDAPFDGGEKEYTCAIGAAYAALLAIGREPTLADVVSRFPEQYRSEQSEVPMSVLCDVLRGCGVPAEAVKFDPDSLARGSFPAVLLIYPAGLDRNSRGHYVLLKEVGDNEVVLIDPSDRVNERRLTRSQLSRYWNGYAITLGRNGPPLWQYAATVFLLLFALYEVSAAVVVVLRASRRTRVPAATTAPA